MNGTNRSKPSMAPAAATLPALARTCKVPGCTVALSPTNMTGFCHQHRGRHRNVIEKTNGHAMAPAPAETVRTCKAPDCNARLAHNNKTGFCTDHQVRVKANGAADEGAHSGAHGSNGAAVAKANGHGNGAVAAKANGNGNSRELALEERVNLVISAIPLKEKVRMISSWLRAEL